MMLHTCVSGPLEGPQQLRVEEHQSYNGDYRYIDTRPTVATEQSSLNSSDDRIRLMVTWRVRSISYYYLMK